MNTYNIAPTQTKMLMDPDLLASFEDLRSTLRWRPLTQNLESCEEGGFLYFRITLRLGSAGTTYAGFASGAPFMLTRDCKVKKKGFFLRHWVRQEATDNKALPVTKLDHMQLAVVGEIMLVRVHIDREMTLADTFKSVPFATWMFQVVQVDAAIAGAPGIRFAFAIERTVTPEERVVIQSNVEHTKEQIKLQRAASKLAANRVGPIRAPPRPIPVQSEKNRVSKQPAAQARPSTAAKTMPTSRRPPPSRQRQQQQQQQHQQQPSVRPMPPAGMRGIVTKTLHPQNAVPVSAVPLAPHPPSGTVPVAGARSAPRATVRGNYTNGRAYGGQASAGHGVGYSPAVEKRVTHPYLKLWENRSLDDPYEPFFIVDSDENKEKMSKTWRVEDCTNASLQFNYKRLQSLPGADYPSYFFDVPNANNRTDVGDDLLIMYPAKKIKLMAPEAEAGLALGQLPEKEGDKSPENESKMDVEDEPEKKVEAGNSIERASQNSEKVDDGEKGEQEAGKNPDTALSTATACVPDVTSMKEVDQKPTGEAENPLGQELGHKPGQELGKIEEDTSEKGRMEGPSEEHDDEPAKEAEQEIEACDTVAEIQDGKDVDKDPKLVDDTVMEVSPEEETEKTGNALADVQHEERASEPNGVPRAKQNSATVEDQDIEAGLEHEDIEETPESEIYSSYDYIAAVKAAAEYNANLAVDRAALQCWLLEDQRIGEENEGSKDDDDNASSSSG